MKKELLQQHFQKSEFDEMQSDALAAVFEQYREEMATKHDLALLRSELKGEMSTLRSELKGEMSTLRSELTGGMSALKADLTWRFVALTIFLGTVMTIVGVFVD